jgi:hypothetical protein
LQDPKEFPEDILPIVAYTTAKEIVTKFSTRKGTLVVYSTKMLWMLGPEEEKELTAWKHIFANADIPEKQSIEV